MTQGGRRRGSIAMTMLTGTAGFVLALACVAIAFSHWNFCLHSDNAGKAEEMAESMVSEVLAQVKGGVDFGSSGHPAFQRLQEIHADPQEPKNAGMLAFSPSVAEAAGIPASSNTLGSTDPNAPGILRLIGVGRWGGVERRVEVVYHTPAFPYSIAASGKVKSEGGLLVAAMRTVGSELLPDGPGNLASNSPDPQAVQLGADTRVTGDVRTPGGVDLAPGATVEGEVRAPSDPAPIPDFNLEDYRPSGATQTLAASATNPVLSGFYESPGDVHVEGDLKLNGAYVFIPGNLTVTGSLQGKGALVTTGSLTVQGGAAVVSGSQDQVAVLSGGNVKITGSGAEGSAFQGLVYTKGDFRAEDIKLLGSFVTQGVSAGVGHASLKDVVAIHSPALAKFRIPVVTPPPAIYYTPPDPSAPPGTAYSPNMSFFVSSVSGVIAQSEYVPGSQFSAPAFDSYAVSQDPAGGWSITMPDGSVTHSDATNPEEMRADLFEAAGNPQLSDQPNVPSQLDAQFNALFAPLPAGGPPPGPLVPPPGPPQPPPHVKGFDPSSSIWSFELNEFLSPEQRLRQLSWRRI